MWSQNKRIDQGGFDEYADYFSGARDFRAIGVRSVMFKLKHAHREIEQLLKNNAQLQTQKDVAETQVKHFEVRKKNEENTRNTGRDDVINRLQQSGDLRD